MTPNKQLEIQRSNFHIQLQKHLAGDYKTEVEYFFQAWPNFFLHTKQWMDVSGHQSTETELPYYSFSFYLEQYQQYSDFISVLYRRNSFYFFLLEVQGDWHTKFCPQWDDCCKIRCPNPLSHG